MRQTRLINICQDILSRWREKKEIDEEQGYIFFDGILDELSGAEEETGPDYKKVSARLNEMWQYRNLDGLSPEEIFLCGGLWGGIKIAEMNRRRFKQQKTVEEFARIYESKLWFFEAIALNPGIQHKELAQKGKQSASQLSQFAAGAAREGLISYNRVGREKYYYLQKRGELVYAELKKNYRYEYEERKRWIRLAENNEVLETALAPCIEEMAEGQKSQSLSGCNKKIVQRSIKNQKINFNNDEAGDIVPSGFWKEELDIPCQNMISARMAIADN